MDKISQKTIKIKDGVSGYDKTVISKTYRNPKTGIVENFFVDEGKDSVQVFAIVGNHETDPVESLKVICVRQFRPGSEKIELELPGGGLDFPEEDPVDAARRELLEETSYTSHYLVHMCGVPYSPYSTGTRHTVLATNAFQATQQLNLDPNEDLKPILIPLTTLVEKYVRSGTVRGHDAVLLGLDRLGLRL